MTRVSVIVPAYNSAAYLREALESILNQTITDLELIVVDDASTDDTASIASRLAAVDNRVRLISRERPSGKPAAARNEGIRHARGVYVAFLDSDDVSAPDRLELTAAALTATGSRLAFADYRRFDDATGIRESEPALVGYQFLDQARDYLDQRAPDVFVTRSNFVGLLLAQLPVVAPPTVIMERSLLMEESYWFDEALRCGEDQDLWLRLAARSQFAFVNRPLTFVRKHATSLTASQHVRTIEDVVTVRQSNLERLRSRLSSREIAETRSRIAAGLLDVGYAKWVAADGFAARKAFRESWAYKASVAAIRGYAKACIPRASAQALVSTIRPRMRRE